MIMLNIDELSVKARSGTSRCSIKHRSFLISTDSSTESTKMNILEQRMDRTTRMDFLLGNDNIAAFPTPSTRSTMNPSWDDPSSLVAN